MRAVKIAGAEDRPLGAPPDWNPEENGHCGALFVRREVTGGIQFMRSAWEVDDNEAMLLFAGARLTLGIAGSCHPVVSLGVAELPPDFEPTVHARRYNDTNGLPHVRVEMMFPFAGGRRAFCNVQAETTMADAVSIGVTHCEALARREGWIE